MITIEHDKRKHEILQKSLDVFIEEGYENVTLQKIADKCKITRTSLYLYFKDKREIFIWSIKELTKSLEDDYKKIEMQFQGKYELMLRKIFERLLVVCNENFKLFVVLLPYLTKLQKEGIDSGVRVTRRIIKIRRLISKILRNGINNGEFKNLNVKNTNDMLYGLIESAIFKLLIMNRNKFIEMKDVIYLAIDNILIK